ncbi:ADP-ribosyltransferase [Streptomyces echinoruber]|uniref:Phage head morphogenesis domain-containing protein n=1 Tax=Streptomyces echinoruber TaxID=68898 RepID=A0A918QW15_9ACTN|nr:ADP-ribosyltransferase [Streptomyces echinoruber]GGZ73260.1 hypothetical protein GCM10010389_08520 [Streptomyces echinoruber]
MPDVEQQLRTAEEDVAQEVRAALDEVAADTDRELADATEIVAARFSLAQIGWFWKARVPRIVRRLLGVAESAAAQAAADTGTALPDGWEDLPGRYDDGALPPSLGSYVTDTEHLLRAVGDRLTAAALAELAAGLDAGENVPQLKARLREVFSREGAQLGETREERIARTEATRAWNATTLAAARELTGPGRPLVKQWVTRHDARVRHAHNAVDGALRLIDEAFTVAGVPMQYPGDPLAPAELTVNCRCILRLAPEARTAAAGSQVPARGGVFESKEDRFLRAFHGTRGRPSYIKYHPSGRNKRRTGLTRHANGGWLGSDRFTEDEHSAVLRRYTGSGYESINSALRNGIDPSTSERTAERLRQQISALTDLISIQDPAPSETTLYRRMEHFQLELNEGDEFHDKGFLSTSKREDVLPIEIDPDDPNHTFFRIVMPKGARMLDVDSVRSGGFAADEQEVILPPGTKFRVRKVVDRGGPTSPPYYELEPLNALTAAARVHASRSAAVLAAASGGSDFQKRITWAHEDIVIDRRAKASAAVTAAAAAHTGAMIALLPAQEDAQRLALADGEPPEELHCTLMFLGEADDWSTEQREALVAMVREYAPRQPVAAHAFGVAHWNPHGDDPVWVWNMSDHREGRHPSGPDLQDARIAALYAVEDAHDASTLPEIPVQHSPWQPHVTAVYDTAPERFHDLVQQVGPVVFDRLRVAFAGEHVDIPLAPQEEDPTMATPTEAEAPMPPPVRTWSTPDGTALAYLGQATGDGRIFAQDSLYWDGDGPWPLSYCERMGQAHDGAELAGAIQALAVEGDRLTGSGVLYLTTSAGWEAANLLDQEAPLGVSVDLDDVSVQILDNTARADEDTPMLLEASFSTASVVQLTDGAWQITAASRPEWTASGAEMAHTTRTVTLFTSPGGVISPATARQVFGAQLTAAAGDPDDPDAGVVVHEEESGAYLLRITRARVRGATLVAMPAFDQARIVLDAVTEQTASGPVVLAAGGDNHERVVTYVCSSPVPVTARDIAEALSLDTAAVRSHLNRALEAGRIVRLSRGLYVGASTDPEGEVSASIGHPQTLDAGIVASAMQVMQARDPFPAAWFREPTEEELPPDSGGVHVVDGRAYGWVAQAGVPHEVHGRKVTIDKLAQRGIDTSYFLRTKLRLDDGSEVAVGPMTMNVGHHRDGFECETSVCQFDDSRTVGAVVTVGINERGMWFSGAAADWLSPWDGLVYRACQPSYHMTQGSDGRWQLKAVLSVPTPGHPSRLAASGADAVAAVIDRSNIAITAAAAALAEAPPADPHPKHARAAAETPGVDLGALATAIIQDTGLVDALVDAFDRRQAARAAARAEADQLAALLGEPASAPAQQEGN